ncbi:cytochrome b [Leptothrix sp. BB-4]
MSLQLATRSQRYDLPSMVFHWLTAIVVTITFILGPGGFGRLMHEGVDPATRLDIVWHETLGLSIFGLTLLRLLWVAMRPAAPRFPASPVMALAAKAGHLGLWTLLLVLPLTALLALGSEGHPLTLLGGVRLDKIPFFGSTPLGEMADWGEVHELLGDAIMWIAGLHAAAAIFHHVILKDGVLRSMLPR